jgi:hypothetical protein
MLDTSAAAQLVGIGDVCLGQQALDEGLEQGETVAQALDAAVEALLAGLGGEAFDVVHVAVATCLLARLLATLLLARLAFVAARFGTLPLVERHTA